MSTAFKINLSGPHQSRPHITFSIFLNLSIDLVRISNAYIDLPHNLSYIRMYQNKYRYKRNKYRGLYENINFDKSLVPRTFGFSMTNHMAWLSLP